MDLSVVTTLSTEAALARLSSSTGLATARIPSVKMNARKVAKRENNMVLGYKSSVEVTGL